MQAHEFSRLGQRTCELLQLRPIKQHNAATGVEMLHLKLSDISACLLYAPNLDPRVASVIVELGDIARDGEVQAWREMLEANHRLRRKDAPRYGRDPGSGLAILQWAFPIHGASPEAIRDTLLDMAATARNWHACRSEVA